MSVNFRNPQSIPELTSQIKDELKKGYNIYLHGLKHTNVPRTNDTLEEHNACKLECMVKQSAMKSIMSNGLSCAYDNIRGTAYSHGEVEDAAQAWFYYTPSMLHKGRAGHSIASYGSRLLGRTSHNAILAIPKELITKKAYVPLNESSLDKFILKTYREHEKKPIPVIPSEFVYGYYTLTVDENDTLRGILREKNPYVSSLYPTLDELNAHSRVEFTPNPRHISKLSSLELEEFAEKLQTSFIKHDKKGYFEQFKRYNDDGRITKIQKALKSKVVPAAPSSEMML